MRKSRFTEGQIVGILKELRAGTKSATLSRKYGVAKRVVQLAIEVWRPLR
jgi:hypothetical protein